MAEKVRPMRKTYALGGLFWIVMRGGSMSLCSVKEKTDCRVASLLAMTGILYTALSFAKWHFLHTGDPSVG